MILLSSNIGSMNPKTISKLANFIFIILALTSTTPNVLLLQETGRSDDESPKFGFSKQLNSYNYKNNNQAKLDDKELRRSMTYTTSTSEAPEDLQLIPDSLAIIDTYKYSHQGSNRARSMKLLILNLYRNHKLKKDKFKELVENVIFKAETEFFCEGIIAMGDTNDTAFTVKDLVELPHDGLHRHRPKSRLTNIDKVLVSRNLFDLGTRVMVLPTAENIDVSEDETLGHKTLVLFINEEMHQEREIKTVCMTKFKFAVRQKFEDVFTNNFITKIQNQRIAALNPLLSGEHDNLLNYDPAEEFNNTLKELMDKSTKIIKRTQPIQMHDLENNATMEGPKSIKAFSRFYSTIKENMLIENELSSLDESKKLKPKNEDLASYLEKKLNRGHEADPDKIDLFIKSRSKPDSKIVPKLLTIENIKDSLSSINKTKTPWLNGVSPKILISTLSLSNNATKIVKEILNSTLIIGKLFSSMTKDRVFFLFKKGDVEDTSNYRPISIDNPLTKLACLLYNKFILKYVKKFMDPRNYSYTENKSTNTAIIKACTIVQQIRARGNYAAIFCTDCSGAFETIQTSLIKGALDSQIQQSGNIKPIDWISSYLQDKKLYTEKNQDKEELIEIKRNLPQVGSGQGSMISPKLWLIQSSASLHWLDDAKEDFIRKYISLVIDIFLLAFADDNIAIVEVDLRYEMKCKTIMLCNMRMVVDDFLEIWEKILTDCGMILNQTKTEILVPGLVDNSRYPEFKKSIKWLGIHLKLDDDGYLVSDVDLNIQMIRQKTWGKFNEITLLTTSILVKLKVFTLYVESIINFCLIVVLAAGSKFKHALSSFQVLQNQFLRRMTGTGMTSGIVEMHQVLQVHKIDYKLARMAFSEWKKLDQDDLSDENLKNKKSIVNKMEKLKNDFTNLHTNKNDKFNISEYKTWKEKSIKKLLRVTKKSRKAKEHQKEINKLRKIIDQKFNL